MKPARFRYWDPPSLEETITFLEHNADEAKLLAGGQSLMPMISMRLARPSYLVDINNLQELDSVREESGWLRVGAMTRQDTLLRSPEARRSCPLLAKAIPHIGHMAIRYRGTIGGSMVHADPSAELPAVAIALDAEFTLRGPDGARTLAASEFFLSFFTTAADADEVLTEIAFPVQRPGAGTAVLEMTRRHGDFALAGVAVAVDRDDGGIGSARVCAFGVDEVPRRIDEAESVLADAAPTTEVLAEASEAAARGVEPESDMHATSAYRREMIRVLTSRALGQALQEAAVAPV
jgi:aerobic carbon-monoxide dehydrogenase medium subunit